MTTKAIIEGGLAVIADGPGFRQWAGKFKCIPKQFVRPRWDVGFYVSGSLAELAFELRDKCSLKSWGNGIRAVAEVVKMPTQLSWDYFARPEHWIIAAIAALEGEDTK